MLNKNIPFEFDYQSKDFDDLYKQVKSLILEQKSGAVNISGFVLIAKQRLKMDAEHIKLGIVVVSKRNPGLFYLERISLQYTDQRRHYVLYDGFIRSRILIKNMEN